MRTEIFSGYIDYRDSCGEGIILLEEEDGWVNLAEAFSGFDGYEVQVNYWITDEKCSKDEMLAGWLKKVFGCVEAEVEVYNSGSWTYADLAYFVDRGSIRVGDHNLFEELSENNGRYVIISVNIKD